MKLELPDYSTIIQHFKELTGEHCEFVQDLRTMFLNINRKIYKAPRFEKEVEKEMSSEELIAAYILLLEETVIGIEGEDFFQKNKEA